MDHHINDALFANIASTMMDEMLLPSIEASTWKEHPADLETRQKPDISIPHILFSDEDYILNIAANLGRIEVQYVARILDSNLY